MPNLRRTLPLLAAAVLALAGCAKPPAERVTNAWQAGEDEDLEAFAQFFLPASAEFIRNIATVKARNKVGSYLTKPFDVLPKGEILEVSERDNLALVTVKAKGKTYPVRLLRERGIWFIDAFSLPTLWEPLAGAATIAVGRLDHPSGRVGPPRPILSLTL